VHHQHPPVMHLSFHEQAQVPCLGGLAGLLDAAATQQQLLERGRSKYILNLLPAPSTGKYSCSAHVQLLAQLYFHVNPSFSAAAHLCCICVGTWRCAFARGTAAAYGRQKQQGPARGPAHGTVGLLHLLSPLHTRSRVRVCVQRHMGKGRAMHALCCTTHVGPLLVAALVL